MKYVDSLDLYLAPTSVSALIIDMNAGKCKELYSFETSNEVYRANTLDEAAQIWKSHGAKPLLNVGRTG